MHRRHKDSDLTDTGTFQIDIGDEGTPNDLSRRSMLQYGIAGAALVGGGLLSGCSDGSAVASPGPTPGSMNPTPLPTGNAGNVFGVSSVTRADQAFAIRMEAANANFNATPNFNQLNNGDEALYPNFIGSFSKSLEHNALGEVVPASYQSYLDALDSGNPADFDNIIVGNPSLAGRIGLVSPQAAYSFELGGLDAHAGRMAAAPTFNSAETAAEMVELYWYSLCRDIPYTRYDTDPLIAAAVADLNALSRNDIFASIGGEVTPQSLFRGDLPGATTGPFMSQFLVRPFFLGAFELDQRYPRVAEGSVNQFMTGFDEYLAIQNGAPPTFSVTFDSTKTFLYSLRQLGEFVHVDLPIQSGTYAAMILNELGAYDPTFPYQGTGTQDGFVNFGLADALALMTRGPRHALTAAWYQKWLVHRRVRPEAYACRVNVQQRGLATYDLHPDVLNSDALARINAAATSADDRGLLPMGYPEGSPAHPAYPGGHSTFAAAAATILKGYFDDTFVFPDPVQPNDDGTVLIPWTGEPLTVGGELNKLACNITHGRDGAGMHYRSDGLGNFIGEEVGISILADYSRTYNEQFDGFTLTRFNGERIRIRGGGIALA
ncbi:MAG: vanadium-dependent haloperoxidase [Pseudomonadota bacterium]